MWSVGWNAKIEWMKERRQHKSFVHGKSSAGWVVFAGAFLLRRSEHWRIPLPSLSLPSLASPVLHR